MKLADHCQRQGSVPAHNFVHSGSLPNHSNQRAIICTLLFESELDGLDRVRHVNGEVLPLIGFNQRDEHIQPVSVGGTSFRAPQCFDFLECCRVVSVSFDWFYLHISPLLHRFCRTPRESQSI